MVLFFNFKKCKNIYWEGGDNCIQINTQTFLPIKANFGVQQGYIYFERVTCFDYIIVPYRPRYYHPKITMTLKWFKPLLCFLSLPNYYRNHHAKI